jgi:hypothetical protein
MTTKKKEIYLLRILTKCFRHDYFLLISGLAMDDMLFPRKPKQPI